MSLPRNQANLPTVGQYGIVPSTAPSDEVGWTSEARSRRSPKPRRSKQSQEQAPYVTARPARPSQKKGDPNYIPRPENSFILFRKEYVRTRPRNEPIPGGESLSKHVGKKWKNLPAEVKLRWGRRAAEAGKEHARKYPDWKYCPVRKDKAKKQTDAERKIEERSVTFHSTDSSPDPAPSPASDSVSSNTTTGLASLRVPPFLPNDSLSVTITTVPMKAEGIVGVAQPQRLPRLPSWDDSVIHPQGLSNSFHNQGRGDPAVIHTPTDLAGEALRRHSSSAPLPDHSALSVSDSVVVRSCQPDAHCDNKAGVMSSYPYYHPPSRRTSYSSGIRPGFVYQDTVFPVEDKANGVPIEPLIAQPVDLQVHNVCYRESSVKNDLDATIAPGSLAINPQPALLWSTSDVDASRDRAHPSSPSSVVDPFMFVSPIQPLPSYLPLDVETSDRQFNQRWSELSFCSSPEQFSFPISNSTVETASSATLGGTMISEVEKRSGEISVEKKPLKVEQVVPRQVQERHASRSSKHSLLYNPYTYKPRKPMPPPPQIQAPVLVEDLFKAGLSEDSYYGSSEFDQYTRSGIESSHSSSSDVGTDSTLFSAVSMDPLLNFFPISYNCASGQSFDSSWALFDGAVEA